MKKFIFIVKFVVFLPWYYNAQVYSDTLEFTIERVTEAIRFKEDGTVHDTIQVSLKHEFCRRLVGTTGYDIFAEISEGVESMIVPNFPVGVWDIGYRAFSSTVDAGEILWSSEQSTPWTLDYRTEDALIIIARKGGFIGCRLIRKQN